MELDWTTFILELINFLVLIWLLNRFLYKPVMKVIAQRKTTIQKTQANTRSVSQSGSRKKTRLAQSCVTKSAPNGIGSWTGFVQNSIRSDKKPLRSNNGG